MTMMIIFEIDGEKYQAFGPKWKLSKKKAEIKKMGGRVLLISKA